ncbi:YbbR-like domain-containing protein [Alkalihalobacterium alkalinitrilicum]|uniref:CdaR family protein n=1 Tax=Alkalihalobacterium alkalinitrilicum TaxID=427920 RepID=UPI0009954E1F|nr:CdaR family protein [Alkalihalobacterium alkalinitrilicum]
MDKFFNSPWFVKIVSFFIALMLFMMVNYDNLTNQPVGVLPTVTPGTYTLEEVDVTAYYDEDRFAITEMTESVQVNLKGPQSSITLFQVTRPSYEVFADLTDREAGVHHISIEHRGFPNDVSVTIVPQFVRVVLQEKRTVSLPVEVDLVNRAEIAEGYSIGTPIVTPVNVEITAAEEFIDQVAIAKVYVDVKDADKTIEKSAPVKLYDHFGNELHLDIEPSVVDVRVPITSPYKEVPVKVTKQGELPEGVSINSITVDPKVVTIFGPQNVLNNISLIEGIILDLNEISQSQTVQLNVPRPRGVEKVDPEVVNVTIELSVEETLTIEDIPLEITGLPEGFTAEIITPENQVTDILVKGSRLLLDKLTTEDIQAFVDINQLSPGEHEVDIQIVGPQNLLFFTEIEKALIVVEEMEQEDQ